MVRAARPPIAPVLPTEGATALRPLGLDRIRLTGGNWLAWSRQTAEVSLPHVVDWLERMNAFGQYRRLDPTNPDRGGEGSRDLPWAWSGDSEIYKALEAASWSLATDDDSALREFVDSAAELFARVQAPDGYLHTQIQNSDGVVGRDGGLTTARFESPSGEELYCLGHLIQAGIAHRRATGESSLFDVAKAAADCIVATFRERTDFADAHPEVEMALVEMYRETGDGGYLTIARQFLEVRGHGRLLPGGGGGIARWLDYQQDGVPVRDQVDVVGHAVCALYLLCGMADVAIESHDSGLLAVVLGQWESMNRSKVYLTGAVGSRHEGEAFGDPYELPQDVMYGESCATVAFAMLSWRLLLATGESRFADAFERATFNLLRASVSLDGRGFFYCNPSQRRTPRPAADPEVCGRLGDSAGTRPPWFPCACCPPNVLRAIASVGAHVATTDDGGVQLHQYLPTAIDTGASVLRIETDYPDTGIVRVVIDAAPETSWTLGLRKPGWAPAVQVSVAGEDVHSDADERGYVRITRVWRPGDEVVLTLPVAPRLTVGHPSVDAVRGQVAVERGPIVYALESPDQDEGLDLERVSLIPALGFEEIPIEIGGHRTIGLRARGVRRDDAIWADALWRTIDDLVPETGTDVPLTFVPYGLWANRGPSTLRVFVPLAS
jgi:DUF1680 family protein